jgi:MFS family permease
MMLVPVVPLFFTEELDLSYQAISKARVTITSLGVAVLSPLMGRLMDRYHPVRLNVLSFAALALYPGMLLFGVAAGTLSPVFVAYTAFALYAVAMSGINVTWNVGSASFAPPGQGGYYQGVHVAMVGVRGVFGPLIGYVVLRLFGYREVFLVTAMILLVSAASSALLARRLPKV